MGDVLVADGALAGADAFQKIGGMTLVAREMDFVGMERLADDFGGFGHERITVHSDAALGADKTSAAGAAYTASKHGVVGLTKSLAVMYRTRGIRTNAIAPGATATHIQVDARSEAEGPATLAPYLRLAGNVAQAEEQAAAIVFLASDAASNINGAILPVDNGWSAI